MPRGRKKTECAYFGGAACNSKRKNSGSREWIEAASFSTKRNSGENWGAGKGNIVPGGSCFGKNRRRCSWNIKSPRSERRTVI